MLQRSAIPTMDSTVWWIPTNHATSALDCNTPCLALETPLACIDCWASSVVQWCQWGPIFLSFKPCIPLLEHRYVACHWRTASGVFQRPLPKTNGFLEDVYKTEKAANSDFIPLCNHKCFAYSIIWALVCQGYHLRFHKFTLVNM